MNLLAIKPDPLAKRDEALNENFSTINEKVETTARTADAGLEAAFDAHQKVSTVEVDLSAHVSNKNNPHNVTVEQLGLANAYVYRGSVANYSALPSSPATGDVYNIVNSDNEHNIYAGDNVAWNGTAWDNLSGVFDTSALEALISANTEAIAENAKTLTAHGSSITELTTQTQNNSTTLIQLQATVSDIKTQVGASVGIDDTTVSGSSTYSSQKIESLMGGSNLVPKTGNRGVLGGYQTVVDGHIVYPDYVYEQITMDDTPNSAVNGGNVFISEGTSGTTFVKIIALAGSPQVQVTGSADKIKWVDGEAPEITKGVLIYLWFEDKGYLRFIPFPS